MAPAKKKRKTITPPPIEGEILSGNPPESGKAAATSPGESRKAKKAGDGAGIFRRSAWYLGAAGTVFIAGLVAAPTIQKSIDSLLGREETAAAETRESIITAPAPEAVPAPVETLAVPDEPPESEPVSDPTDNEESPVAAQPAAQPQADLAAETLAADYRKIVERLEALEARLASVEARPMPDPDSRPQEDSGARDRIADLEARLVRVESHRGTEFTGAGADRMLLALAHLSQRLDAGEAYAGEMLEFQAFFAALPVAARAASEINVSVLAAEADSGVKNAAMLHRALTVALPAALAVAALPEDAGWWDRVWAGLKGVVVVRRVGQVEGAGAEAALARAEFYLAEGDIAAALGEVRNLEARIQESLAPWQAEAVKSLAARGALDALIGSYSASPAQRPPAPSVEGG